jgi:hypothetical protein
MKLNKKRFGVSQTMSQNDFRDQRLKGFWLDLKDHLVRGAIILVHPDLDLGDVASKIALDQVATVQGWIANGLLIKPTPAQIHAWNEMPQKEFYFVIAQPYVLIQEMSH